MPDFFIDAIGYAAALVTTLCWLPQALHILRTRDTRAISLASYGAFATGVGLWLVYGLCIGNLPVIAANAVTLALTLAIVFLKVRYG